MSAYPTMGMGHHRPRRRSTPAEAQLRQLRFPRGRLLGRAGEERALRELYRRAKNHAIDLEQQQQQHAHAESRHNSNRPLHVQAEEEEGAEEAVKDMAVVCGPSGVGKTALVESLRSRVSRVDYFASGKFNSMKRGVPYSAIVDALGELASQMKHEDAARRELLRERLGRDLSEVIARCVPAMRALLSPEDGGVDAAARRPADTIGSVESRNQFDFAFRSLFRGICEVNGKALVLFVDDLQWADDASLDLIKVLATDKENPSMLIIGSYTENEINPTHPVSSCLREIEESGAVNTTRLPIGNLALEVVNDFIAETLHMKPVRTMPLAVSIHSKTHGNVFFVIQFLKSLVEEGLLRFNFGTKEWGWDLASIHTKCDTSNVADLMRGRLQRIPADERQVLLVSSCLGSSFDLAVLILVLDFFQEVLVQNESTTQHVKQALSFLEVKSDRMRPFLNKDLLDGLLELEPIFQDDAFRFCHDQIQQAAFALIPEESRGIFQYVIGKALVTKLSSEQLSNVLLFGAVDLLNTGVEDYRVSSKDENRGDLFTLAQLNLNAGKQAMGISAFGQSAAYLKTSIELMQNISGGEEAVWVQHHDFCLEAFQAYADSLSCHGEFDMMRSTLGNILERATTEGRMAAFATLVNGYGAKDDYREAFDTGFRALEELGETFPRTPGTAIIITELLKTRRFMRDYPLDAMRALPQMNDPSREIMTKILARLIIFAQLEFPTYLPLLTFRLLRWSCLYGLTSSTPPAIAVYGLIVSSGLGDLKAGYDYAMLAKELLERSDGNSSYCFTSSMASLTMATQQPIISVIKNDLVSYQVGMEHGENFYAMAALAQMLVTATHAGRPLSIVESDMNKYIPHFKEYKQTHTLRRILPCLQFVLTMMNDTPRKHNVTSSSSLLDGIMMNENDYIGQMWGDPGQIAYTLVHKQILLYYFGNLKEAAKLSDKTKGYTEKFGKALFLGIRYKFFNGLTALAMLQKQKGSFRFGNRKWHQRKTDSLEKMSIWRVEGNVNVAHMLLLLEAEEYVLSKKVDMKVAKSKYNAAISIAAKAGFANDKALANERAGAACLANNDSYWASVYICCAHKCWAEYGALAMCRKLEDMYPKYITEEVKNTSMDAFQRAKAGAHNSSSSEKKRALVFSDASNWRSSPRATNFDIKMRAGSDTGSGSDGLSMARESGTSETVATSATSSWGSGQRGGNGAVGASFARGLPLHAPPALQQEARLGEISSELFRHDAPAPNSRSTSASSSQDDQYFLVESEKYDVLVELNPKPKKSTSQSDSMGAMEGGDGASTGSVPEYKIDASISEMAKSFVNQFAKAEGPSNNGSEMAKAFVNQFAKEVDSASKKNAEFGY